MRGQRDKHLERAALREAAELKARAKAERDERIRRLVARGWTPAEVHRATGLARSVVEKAVGAASTPP